MMSSPRLSESCKWLLVEWNTGSRDVVHINSLVKPKNKELRVGDTITVTRYGRQETVRMVSRARERRILDPMIERPRWEEEAGPSKRTYEEEPKEFCTSSESSWGPRSDDISTDSLEDERKNTNKKKRTPVTRATSEIIKDEQQRTNAVINCNCNCKKAPLETMTIGIREFAKMNDLLMTIYLQLNIVKRNYNILIEKLKEGNLRALTADQIERLLDENVYNDEEEQNLRREIEEINRSPEYVLTNQHNNVAVQLAQNNVLINQHNNVAVQPAQNNVPINQHNNVAVQPAQNNVLINQHNNVAVQPAQNNVLINQHNNVAVQPAQNNVLINQHNNEAVQPAQNNVLINQHNNVAVQPAQNNVLINQHNNVAVKPAQNNEQNLDKWVPIGTGQTVVHRDRFTRVNWKSFTIATRSLLLALFPRSVLATHSLTGKKSPAFQNKPAKMCLDPKIVNDIIIEIKDRFQVRENLIRAVITTKCADECKMWKTRMNKRKPKRNKENKPPREEKKKM